MAGTESHLAWHYTTGEKFKEIIETGVLLPTAIGIAAREQPILWFSLEQFWEPTASKAIMVGGERFGLDMQRTYENGAGLARFGISPAKLVPWPRLALKANIPPRVRIGLEKVAREQRANPANWLGAIGRALPVQDIEAIDIYDGQVQKSWVRIQPPCDAILQAIAAKAGHP